SRTFAGASPISGRAAGRGFQPRAQAAALSFCLWHARSAANGTRAHQNRSDADAHSEAPAVRTPAPQHRVPLVASTFLRAHAAARKNLGGATAATAGRTLGLHAHRTEHPARRFEPGRT